MLTLPGSARWPRAYIPRRRRSAAWSRILAPRGAGLAHQPGSCCGCRGGGYACGSCTIPASNLTVSWVNPIVGNGSTTLSYATTPAWTSACTNQLLFELACVGGVPALIVTYYLSGSCPTGQAQTCTTYGATPYKLTGGTVTCGSSFLWVITLTSSSCPVLSSQGYTSFTISP